MEREIDSLTAIDSASPGVGPYGRLQKLAVFFSDILAQLNNGRRVSSAVLTQHHCYLDIVALAKASVTVDGFLLTHDKRVRVSRSSRRVLYDRQSRSI